MVFKLNRGLLFYFTGISWYYNLIITITINYESRYALFHINSNTNKTKHHANSTGNLRNTLVGPMWQGMARRQDAKKLHPGPLSTSATQAHLKQASAIESIKKRSRASI